CGSAFRGTRCPCRCMSCRGRGRTAKSSAKAASAADSPPAKLHQAKSACTSGERGTRPAVGPSEGRREEMRHRVERRALGPAQSGRTRRPPASPRLVRSNVFSASERPSQRVLADGYYVAAPQCGTVTQSLSAARLGGL